jgi:TIR domain/Pentapeptide repeats (9 copies)
MEIGYSAGSPKSPEGRRVSKATARKTYYEWDGWETIQGKRLEQKLKYGAVSWNAYRKKCRKLVPAFNASAIDSMSNGSFDKFNLSGGSLSCAKIYSKSFDAANLRDVDAKSSEFDQCKFVDADLRNVNFFSATLNFCKFHNCSLQGAYFVRALLRHCEFKNCKLDLSEFGETDFINVNFEGSTGLSSSRHEMPSYIDTGTLGQKLPLTFLRGVGLSDKLIEARSIKGADYYSCFISFSTRDKQFANKLHRDLQDEGVRCWFAPHDLPVGATTADEIDYQITRLDKLIIIISSKALSSQWVEDEVFKAYAEERRRKARVLVPIRLDNKVMTTNEAWALKLRDQRNIGDFIDWRKARGYRKALDRLISALRKKQT